MVRLLMCLKFCLILLFEDDSYYNFYNYDDRVIVLLGSF